MRVTEIYRSIQGESTRAGLPCTLVRFTGCNLRCRWCDTAYAFDGGEERSVNDIVAQAQALGAPLVLLTGGEPLLQPELPVLAQRLLDGGFEVMVETGGSLDTAGLPTGCVVILDLKCPGSGEQERNLWSNLTRLRPTDEVKFVVADEADYRWAREVIGSGRIPAATTVLLSPVHGELSPADLASWILADGLRARLQVQIHKYIWGADARGV